MNDARTLVDRLLQHDERFLRAHLVVVREDVIFCRSGRPRALIASVKKAMCFLRRSRAALAAPHESGSMKGSSGQRRPWGLQGGGGQRQASRR